jgi:hypothetical protein
MDAGADDLIEEILLSLEPVPVTGYVAAFYEKFRF